jgi:hypothetical protein
MCFVFIWEQTATCATYSINWLVFITKFESVFSAVRTGPLNEAVCSLSLKVKGDLFLYHSSRWSLDLLSSDPHGPTRRHPMCISEWIQGRTPKMCTEVSPSVPHLLQVRLSLSPITHKCLLKVLCPVRKAITVLDCHPLKNNNQALVASLGLEINSQACLCVLQGTGHNTKC